MAKDSFEMTSFTTCFTGQTVGTVISTVVVVIWNQQKLQVESRSVTEVYMCLYEQYNTQTASDKINDRVD